MPSPGSLPAYRMSSGEKPSGSWSGHTVVVLKEDYHRSMPLRSSSERSQ